MVAIDLTVATAVELATAIRLRRVSAAEVVEAHLTRIARHNPAVNAIVTLDEAGARARARAADAALARGELWGPLHGVPFTAKDALATAGMRTTSGFPPLAEYLPAEDATAVARLRAAGAILLGKTNMPPLAGDYQSDNPIFGRTRNPWNLELTAGGSSGGSAAAVASGFTPLDLGSDVAGSIRIPAHFCGVFGLKPTDRRVPTTGHIPEPPGAPRGVRHMNVVGPLARSVDDLELALRLIAGPDGRDTTVPPVPLDRASAAGTPLAAARIAWIEALPGAPVDAATRAAVERVAVSLVGAGARVERTAPQGFSAGEVCRTWARLFAAELGAGMSPEEEQSFAAAVGADAASADPFESGWTEGVGATVRDHTAALEGRDALIAIVERFLETWDAWLLPVCATPAFRHCPTRTPIEVDGRPVAYWTAGLASTAPFSLTGHPVVVLPIGRTADGRPIGAQLVGRRWDELGLLALAGLLAPMIGGWSPPHLG